MKPQRRQTVSELPILRDDGYDPQELSDVIGDLYDTVLDHSLWIGAIEGAARFVRGTGAALYSKNVANQEGSAQYAAGIDPYFTRLYFDKHATFGPTTGGQFLAEIEQPIAVADLMSHPEFLKTRFCREWVPPQGPLDCVNVVLDKSATSLEVSGVFRGERDGMVDDEARHRMRLIVPHIRRALLIGRMFDLKAAEAATFADTLDGLSVGMCLVDAGGRIVHANAAGYAIIAVSDILRSVGGRLVARDAQVDKTLREIFAAAGQRDAALGKTGIAVPLVGKDDERYVAHVLPLISGACRRAGRTYAAAAALFVRRAALEVPSAFEVIGKAFKLTPTELRVLLAIVEVGGVPEVAAALGVAATTIKTHLGRLFEKTGATRQADLVKLVAGYATSLTA
ncbi:helix-turn-helix transcriptional regulator [Bradyrhizobium sp. SSUT18]|uniref:helix-turn-helix transcriptional regulator n=1 Tax=Bradyrhizobium sp. SSUT18 TaxID=3040602 RepID=UPI00244D09C8|nr:helix-turn-helix transcriptional regulator [Bradyrhizobium sp. SSUT18]MDH2406020.1 helix-turn-helix transcriptional regulator [Bradyrhizobium sp. SSUT18]